jgi:hypothetical protein
MRFGPIEIPPGSTINSAFLTVITQQSINQNMAGAIEGHLVPNSPNFTGGDADVTTRVNSESTAAEVNWDGSLSGQGFPTNSPDFKAVITEIIGQGTWVSGNYITILIRGDTFGAGLPKIASFASFEHATYDPPKLTISWNVPVTSSFELLIGGVDYTEDLVMESVIISEALQARGFTMNAVIQINDQAKARPLSGQSIILSRSGIKEFAGRIGAANEVQAMLPTHLAYSLDCIDWTADLDAELLNDVFPSQLAGDTVREIIGVVGRGFSSVGVKDGIVINELEVEWQPPSGVITRISESIEYQWYVDYDRDLQMFFLLDRPAPLTSIQVDTDETTYWDLEISEDWEQVKNRIILTGAKAKSTNQETQDYTGDGTQKFFPLNYEPWDASSITIDKATVPQTLLTDSIDGQAGDGLGASGEVYVCYDNWGVRFPDSHAPGVAEAVEITYNYAYEPVVVVEDPASIALMKALENEGGNIKSNGVHELRFEVPELRVESEDAIFEYGQLVLLRYKDIRYTAEFASDTYGWKPGQHFQLTSGASRRNFDRTMYVVKVTKSIRNVNDTDVEFTYQIEASSSPFPG